MGGWWKASDEMTAERDTLHRVRQASWPRWKLFSRHSRSSQTLVVCVYMYMLRIERGGEDLHFNWGIEGMWARGKMWCLFTVELGLDGLKAGTLSDSLRKRIQNRQLHGSSGGKFCGSAMYVRVRLNGFHCHCRQCDKKLTWLTHSPVLLHLHVKHFYPTSNHTHLVVQCTV